MAVEARRPVWRRGLERVSGYVALLVLVGCGLVAGTPVAPDGIGASLTAEGARVTWRDRSDDEAGFIIYRTALATAPASVSSDPSEQAASDEPQEIGRTGPDAESYIDRELVPGLWFTYAVSAFSAAGESAPAPQVSQPVGAPALLTLTVEVTGDGAGLVESDPTGITCGNDCSAEFTGGTQVTLTAVAAQHSTFAGWTGDCVVTATTCVTALDGAKTVGAAFAADAAPPPGTHRLAVIRTGSGQGTVTSQPTGIDCGATCTADFTSGSSIELRAAAAPGSSFGGWSGACTGTGSCTLVLGADTTLSASFQQPRRLQLAVEGSGVVVSDPAGISCGSANTDCDASFANGSTVRLEAAPDSDHAFEGWSGDCAGTVNLCTLSMTADRQAHANFVAKTIVVTSSSGATGTSDCTLRDAITAANLDTATGGCPAGNGDDVLRLPPAVTITLNAVDNLRDRANGLPSITSTIRIEGHGSTITRVHDESLPFRLFHVSSQGDLTLMDVDLVGGYDSNDAEDDQNTVATAAGIYNRGTLRLVRSNVREAFVRGWSVLGSAIANLGGDISMIDVTLEGNTADCGDGCGGPALYSTGGSLELVDVRVRNNEASGDDATGAFEIHGGSMTITRGTFENNAGAYGGAIYGSADMVLEDCVFSGNWGEYAGAVMVGGTLTIRGSTFSGNYSGFSGGAITTSGTTTISGSTFIGDPGGTSDVGGAIKNTGSLTITGGTIIRDFKAGEAGGAIANLGGDLEIRDSTLAGNHVGYAGFGSGGAIFHQGSGTLVIVDSLLSNNTAAQDGGAIYTLGYLTIAGSNLSGNSADSDGDKVGDGGAVYVATGGAASLRGTVVGGASAATRNSARRGGGIFSAGATLDVTGADIRGNFAHQSGGGIYLASGNGSQYGGTIRANTANIDGGGVYLEVGRFALSNDASITANEADVNHTGSGTGGGVHVNPGATLVVGNGSVTNNAPDDVAP